MAHEIGERISASLTEHPGLIDGILALRDPRARSKAVGEAVERMLASAPSENHHNELIGPFYDTPGLERWTGKTRQAIAKWRGARKVLAVTTDARRILYPSFQFGSHGELLPGLADVLDILSGPFPNPLTQARWLCASNARLGHRSAAEALRVGDLESVLAIAREDARRIAA